VNPFKLKSVYLYRQMIKKFDSNLIYLNNNNNNIVKQEQLNISKEDMNIFIHSILK
jgi:hypothetical protein